MGGFVKIKESKKDDGFIVFNEGYISDGNYAIDASYAIFANNSLETLRASNKPFRYIPESSVLIFDDIPKMREVLEPDKLIRGTVPLIDTYCSYNMYGKNSSAYHIFITDDDKKEYCYIQEKYYQMFLPLLCNMDATMELHNNNKVIYRSENGGAFFGVVMTMATVGCSGYYKCYFEKQQEEKQVTIV